MKVWGHYHGSEQYSDVRSSGFLVFWVYTGIVILMYTLIRNYFAFEHSLHGEILLYHKFWIKFRLTIKLRVTVVNRNAEVVLKTIFFFQYFCWNFTVSLRFSKTLLGIKYVYVTFNEKRVVCRVSLFVYLFCTFNSFMTEVPIIYKPVHWFTEQINRLVSIG